MQVIEKLIISAQEKKINFFASGGGTDGMPLHEKMNIACQSLSNDDMNIALLYFAGELEAGRAAERAITGIAKDLSMINGWTKVPTSHGMDDCRMYAIAATAECLLPNSKCRLPNGSFATDRQGQPISKRKRLSKARLADIWQVSTRQIDNHRVMQNHNAVISKIEMIATRFAHNLAKKLY